MACGTAQLLPPPNRRLTLLTAPFAPSRLFKLERPRHPRADTQGMQVQPEQFDEHEQVASRVMPGVEVDAGIVELIDWLNEHGCHTLFSCQGEPGETPWSNECGYIMFIDANSLEAGRSLLLELSLEAEEWDLALRVTGLAEGGTEYVRRGAHWQYRLMPAVPREWVGYSKLPMRARLGATAEDLSRLNGLVRALKTT